ncbi:MAG: hypothetical protein PHQ05_10005 [Sterolibacterium sp.]|nr:hypothetical protein [Sterolibacterium sp.]
MNGQFSPSTPASLNVGLFARQAPVSARLVTALVVSCLLHAAILVMPYLGSSMRENRMIQRRGEKPPLPFTATLTTRTIAPLAATNAFTVDASYPGLSLLDHGSTVESSSAQLHTEGVDLLPMPAPHYYTTDQLTKRPQPAGEAELEPPEIAHVIASGKMILKLWINELGEVIAVDVEKTDLPEEFSRSAVAAFKRLRFTAGERYGQRVGSVMRIEVSYDDSRLRPP